MVASYFSAITVLLIGSGMVIAYAFPARFRGFVLMLANALCALLTIVAFWPSLPAYFIPEVAGLLGFGFVGVFVIYRMYPAG